MASVEVIAEDPVLHTMQRNRRYLKEYMSSLESLKSGERLRIELTDGEKKNTYRKRWCHAATLVGVGIKFHRTDEKTLIISVIQPKPIIDVSKELPKEVKSGRRKAKA